MSSARAAVSDRRSTALHAAVSRRAASDRDLGQVGRLRIDEEKGRAPLTHDATASVHECSAVTLSARDDGDASPFPGRDRFGGKTHDRDAVPQALGLLDL